MGTWNSAPAQWRNNSKDAAYRAGFDRGYWDGLRHGDQDSRRRAGYDFRSREYKDGERGYSRSMQHKGDYKKGYRQGYESGYNDGYHGRNSARRGNTRFPERYPDRYPGRYPDSRYPSGQYPDYGRRVSSQAWERGMERGYRDGMEHGRSDFRKRRSFDPNRHDDFRDADDGYKSSYGDKREYQSAYRRGFEDGYRQGYRM
jgi:flagellar biosynthesis/type III secretory pathway protein FliH